MTLAWSQILAKNLGRNLSKISVPPGCEHFLSRKNVAKGGGL